MGKMCAILLAAGSMFLTVSALAGETPMELKGAKLVDPAGAKAAMDAGAKFYDVRVAAEYNDEHIKGAVSVPYKEASKKEVNFNVAEDKFDVAKLGDKASSIIIYCNGPECWKSYKASVEAIKAGYTNVYWFRTGIPAWKKAGLPTEK